VVQGGEVRSGPCLGIEQTGGQHTHAALCVRSANTVCGRFCRAFESAWALAPRTSSAWLCSTAKKRSSSG
jgi:cellobiose phosphorylase